MLVVNAANVARVWAHAVEQKGGANIRLRDVSDEVALLALQGPGAETLLAALTAIDVRGLRYYHFAEGTVAGVDCFVSRTGYTGEDGFELYCRADHAESLWHAVAGPGRAEPCGLGARDTLRLEAGFPLYGFEIDDAVTPYEARLGFIVKLEKGAAFIGQEALKRQKLAGVSRRLVGFRITEPKAIARPGYPVLLDGRPADTVRSGTVTPTVGAAIGTTYLPVAAAAPGHAFTVDVRGRQVGAEVVPLPFVPTRTKR
jgi:aminomethyltransferase